MLSFSETVTSLRFCDIELLACLRLLAQIVLDIHRSNCIVLQDALHSASWLGANASRYSTDVCTHTHISSRNSAVHFYYLPFYGRKSLPHADSRCAEGRRAIAEGRFSKNEPRTAPSYIADDEAGMRHVCTYVRAFDTLVPGTTFLIKRECRVLKALHNKARTVTYPLTLPL